ncbi:MAG TPA: metallophosphoesterase family protein [Bryobacteraceae bacterium]|jgi:protein phosphatase
MRILIVSDLHGNAPALDVLPKAYDQLWVLGDLVNYGPDPGTVIDFVRKHATIVVQGNHDYAIGCHKDPRCSEPYRKAAEIMARFTERELSNDDKKYLADLPVSATVEVDGSRFFLCHATPSDPLFSYCPAESNQWSIEVKTTESDVILCGHTHIPFIREVEGVRVANPGSLGQPKTGRPEACYAIWENGQITLHSVPYDYKGTVAAIRALTALGVPSSVKQMLIHVLESGGVLAATAS